MFATVGEILLFILFMFVAISGLTYLYEEFWKRGDK